MKSQQHGSPAHPVTVENLEAALKFYFPDRVVDSSPAGKGQVIALYQQLTDRYPEVSMYDLEQFCISDGNTLNRILSKFEIFNREVKLREGKGHTAHPCSSAVALDIILRRNLPEWRHRYTAKWLSDVFNSLVIGVSKTSDVTAWYGSNSSGLQ